MGENPTKTQIATILGGGVAYRGVLLVEDTAAKAFLTGILEEIEPDFLPQFEIVAAGSTDRITQALQSMPGRQRWLTIMGVYDGDVRFTLQIDPAVGWPHLFLPGDQAPEQMLASVLHDAASVAAIATEFHKTEAQVKLALNHIEGMDHHDVLPEFSRAVTSDMHVVSRGLVHLWLTRVENLQTARDFVRQLNELINGIQRA